MKAGGGAQAGALVSKGLSALGKTFRIGSYTNENPQSNYLNFVSVMATEDNTQVAFSDLPAGLIIKNYSGSTPVNISLNKGESYTIATNSNDGAINRDGLIGCLVSSDKPIVVNCGSANGSFHNGNARDYGIDQIVDLSKVGKEYIFVKGVGDNGWENVLIVAHSDNTSISINGNAPIKTINAGQYYLIEGNFYNSNGNLYVKTSEDVFAYQGVGGNAGNEANQGMFFVPPLSCESRGNLDNIANITRIGNTIYTGGITIVTKVGATVTINNKPISNFSTIGPSTVTGNPDYITYKVLNLSGNVSVQSSDELYCAYFNFNGAATSGSFYSGFPSAPEINFDAQFVTLGNCIPNITLSAANTQNFDSFQWWFVEGSGFVNSGISTPNLTPSIPGKYKLIGIIACSNLILESVEVPVSICPEDIDDDGIIDNIDIDNDNDGILNCTESKGDVTINLANINSPKLLFQDSSINNSIVSGNYAQTSSSGDINTFSGNKLGDFTSTISPANEAEGNYTLSFTEPVNVKFSEDIAFVHKSTVGEFFIAGILPVDKNITLIDPDNRLLVDSNFDGVFETGVTLISGSEIHFKVNPSPLGNTPFAFFADQVNGFSFIHKLNNTMSSSAFNGNLSLNCFKLDTDSDGINDSLDLDSDNDGIPDSIENGGTVVILSNIDADFNGLDDLFDINATPLDSDNDGIFDFYDLDSDNDDIYDLAESGSGLPDSNFDGIIDNINSKIGVNGWDDNAESSPDSNTIGYQVRDTDSDLNLDYFDSDSDDDICSDAIEAGFSDGNNDNFLGDNKVVVDAFGLVNNATDGYTLPNLNYITAAPINVTTQPINTVVCEASNTIITVLSNVDSFQWEVSTDGINWNHITDNAIYSNSQTENLRISNTPLTFNNYKYRVKLDKIGNTCGLYSDEINLTVNLSPIVNSPVELIQCDDDIDGISLFNLTEANNEISSNATNKTFTYFLTQASAQLGDISSSDCISAPTSYENNTHAFVDRVWARIESGCTSVSEIQLRVGTSQIPVGAIDEIITKCDDFLDVNGNNNANNNDRDGIATFDFSYVRGRVENFFLPQTPDISFYRNEADALAEMNPILDTSNYRNIGYPNSQEIYIRVDSQISNDCQAFGSYITLVVESLPVANPVIIERQCDFDLSDSALTYPFDTSQIETNLLNGQNPANVSITYLDALGNLLPSPLPNPFITESQIISIRVTNNARVVTTSPCYDETSIEFIVDAQPIANFVSPFIVCDGEAGDIDDDGVFAFDISSVQSAILSSQTGMEVYYTYLNELGNLTTSQILPNPFNSVTQIVTLEVVNPKNTNCKATTTIDFIVNPLPDLTIETPQIVCSSNPTFTVFLDPIEENPLEVFIYSWMLNGKVIATSPSLSVSTPGTYTVTLTKTNATNCSRSRDIFVNASDIATITQEDITVNDLLDNNTVIINNPGSLGLGNYWFALESIDSSITYPYQDEPVFSYVKAGFYTLYIEDKDGCGTASLPISVIGYPKFFTPNNDGYNDFWQIQGISAFVQPDSDIYIFDRYGKLLKRLNPASPRWDGTFNSRLMSSDDYWFKVLLQDGRIFTGHFSLKL